MENPTASEPVGSDTNAEDAALIRRIARNRDREAFVALLQRHQQSAFSLAMRITRQREQAEEALQESFLRVWNYAASFDGRGSARGWVLRVVARESLAALERAKKVKRAETNAGSEAAKTWREALSPREGLERGELLAALRGALDELPHADRQLVALYYGGGMSQREVGQSLALSQQAVSERITEIVSRLRKRLEAASLAACLPLLSDSGLSDAVTGGHLPPQDWHVALLERLKHAQSAGALAGGKPLALAGALVALLAVVSGTLFLNGGHRNTTAPLANAGTPAPSASSTGDGWQPLEISGYFTRQRGTDPAEVIQPGMVRMLSDVDAQGRWTLKQTPSGAEIVQTRDALEKANYLALTHVYAQSIEWTGTVDSDGAPPKSMAGFILTLEGGEGVRFADHVANAAPQKFRIVAWNDNSGWHLVSLRYDDDGGKHTRAMDLGRAPGVCLGLMAGGRAAFRNLRYRSLPPGWNPQSDPEVYACWRRK